MYCSKSCQKSDYHNHKTLCDHIHNLDEQIRNDKFKNFSCCYNQCITPGNSLKLAKLVGNRPVLNYTLNNKLCQGLWDTGSMISLINNKWLSEEFPDTEIHSIDSFIGTQEGQFSLKAANNTDISIIGVSLFDFGIPDNKINLKVPFIVTDQPLGDPIIGYNVIEHIATQLPFTESEQILKSVLPNYANNKTETVINLIKTNQDNSDFIGNVKNVKKLTIQPKTISYAQCKVDIGHYLGNKPLPVIFQPDLLWENDLVIGETLVTLKPNKTPTINLPISNPTNNPLVLYPKTTLGTINQTSAVIPIELKEISVPQECVKKPNDNSDESQKWLPKVDLSHLPEDRREKVKQVLISECEAFAKDKNDVGKIDNLKLKLNLSDNTPVQKPYRSIPKHLYSEVKQYIENLLTNQWIRKSYSSYASPIVCGVKKKGRHHAFMYRL